MLDPKAPSSALAIAELNKPGAMHEVFIIAWLRSENDDAAKDLAMVSVARVLDPEDAPWQPGGHAFLGHMFSLIRQTWYRQQRKKRIRSEVSDGGKAQDRAANDGELPEAEVARKREFETYRMLGERLIDRLRDDPDARQLLERQMREDLDRSALAAALGWTVDKLRATQKRIAYSARLVRDEWTASEEGRMKELRERATKTSGKEGTP